MKISTIKSIRNRRKKRVCAYARTSTDRINQEGSLEMQKSYYENLILANPEYEFAGIYSDEESGTDAEHRAGFQAMIHDALNNKIDLIYCKSVSRWSRNLLDGKRYCELLHGNGCYVIFEENNLNTADPSSFMMFGFMATVAEDESRSISTNTRWALQKKVERGEYCMGNRVFGYSTINGKLVPNENADAVRFIYQSFLDGKGVGTIARVLEEQGVKGTGGSALSPHGVRYILENEVYKGDRMLQKQAPRDFLSKKPDVSRPYISNYLEKDHEAIVSDDVWEAVQEKLKWPQAHTGGKPHELHGVVFCGCCGAPMSRKSYQGRGEPYKAWICSERKKGRRGNGCKGRIVKEKEILEAMGPDVERIEVKEDGLEVTRRESA